MSLDPESLSRPERCAARGQGRDIRDVVAAAGGCAFCTRRDRTFGIGRVHNCGLTPPRKFPACVGDARGFDFDSDAYQEANRG